MLVLSGHTSPETAYVVHDYPYGFKLRCTIRYWLEYNPKHGFRFLSQTTNPKRGNAWNKPKASTYAKFGAAIYLDETNHVQWTGLTEYCDADEAVEWNATFGSGVPEAGKKLLAKWIAAKVTYEASRKPSDPLSVGLIEARQAWNRE